MKRKPIRVNWDDLEAAFDNPNEELAYYLDLVNGHVVLEGEGEEREGDDETDEYTGEAPSARSGNHADSTRCYIDPLLDETKIDWLERFIDETDGLEPGFVSRISEALEADDPTHEVQEALRDSPDSKDRWYRYRADRLHELIDEWLAQNQVVATDPPPWS